MKMFDTRNFTYDGNKYMVDMTQITEDINQVSVWFGANTSMATLLARGTFDGLTFRIPQSQLDEIRNKKQFGTEVPSASLINPEVYEKINVACAAMSHV